MARKKKQTGIGVLTDMDRYLFGNGTHYEIYHKLGAHMLTYEGKRGMYFAVEAAIERAKSVVAKDGMYLDSSVIAHPDAQIRDAIL